MHPARNGPPGGQGLRGVPVAAQARTAAGQAAQEAEAGQLSAAPARLRVGFAGTPEFAAVALAAILDAGFTIPLVLTRPDRPHGRGLRLAPSPVKALAASRAIPVLQPASLRTPEGRDAALAVPLDVLVVAAYGLILPPEVLAWPPLGCLNIHASLLPRWRGAAPIARAIEAGDAESGVTIMQMDEGLDTGAMLDRAAVPLDPQETAGSLHDRLAALGAERIVAVLRRLAAGDAPVATPQPDQGATYAHKITREEAALDWSQPAAALARRVRAFDPAPGAFTLLDGQVLKIAAADAVAGPPGHGAQRADVADAPTMAAVPAPGTIVAVSAAGIDVACAEGTLRLTEVKPAGGRRMPAAAFARGRGLSAGARLSAGQ